MIHKFYFRRTAIVSLILACIFSADITYLNVSHLYATTQSTDAKNFKQPILKLRANIIKRYPHPLKAFTQGLEVIGEEVYESSGLYRQSFIMRYNLKNPLDSLKKKELPNSIFAEGLTVWGGKIVLLTWKENRAFLLNLDFFKNHLSKAKSVNFDREGWGIAFDGTNFITSDGSSVLVFRDHQLKPLKKNRESSNFLNEKNENQENKNPSRNPFENPFYRQPEKLPVKELQDNQMSLTVLRNQQEVTRLNELEYAKIKLDDGRESFLLANIWGSDFIAVIDQKGEVIAEIDCRLLVSENRPKHSLQKQWGVTFPKEPSIRQYDKSLNGIAILNRKNKESLDRSQESATLKNSQFLLTGKNWQWLYRVNFLPVEK